MSNNEIEKIYPLSPTQEGILFHSLIDPDSKAYYEQVSFMIKGNLCSQTMQLSFRKLIERHDVLRTVFVYTEVEQPLQLVLTQREPQIDYKDLTAYSKEEQARWIEAHKIRDQEHKFDLEAGPLIRMIFFQNG